VRVFRWNNATATVVTGSVVSSTATTIRVAFDGVWTPGAFDHVLGSATSPTVLAQQTNSVYLAGSTTRIDFSAATDAPAFTLA